MKIYITGSPGTGKTTISDNLTKLLSSQLDIKLIGIKSFLKENGLLEEYERERDTTIFDSNKAIEYLQKFLSPMESYILEGPLLPFNDIKFDYIIVLTCSKAKNLRKRLSKRNYRPEKINENIEAELLGEVLGNTLDWLTTKKIYQEPIIIDSCKLSKEEILRKLKNLVIKDLEI